MNQPDFLRTPGQEAVAKQAKTARLLPPEQRLRALGQIRLASLGTLPRRELERASDQLKVEIKDAEIQHAMQED